MIRFTPGYFEQVYYHRNGFGAEYAPLSGDLDADIVIIGMGAAGLAAGRGLVRQLGAGTAKVVGLEAGKIGRTAAAGRNGGQILNCLGEFSYHDLKEEHGQDFAHDFLNRAQSVMAGIRRRREIGWRNGATTLATTKAQSTHLRDLYNSLKQTGYAADLAPGPDEYFTGFDAAFTDPQAGCVDPFALLQHEARDFVRAGGMLAEQTPVHHIDSCDGYYRIHTRGGVVRAPHLVVAAGQGLHDLVQHGGLLQNIRAPAPPIMQKIDKAVLNVGTMIMVTEPLPDALAAPFARSGCFSSFEEPCDYFHLNTEQRLSFGSFGFFKGTASPSVAFLVEKVKNYSPDLYRAIQGRKIGITHFWTGYDTVTTDTEPLVRQEFTGPDAAPNQSITLLTGGNGAGNTGMRVLGDWAADHLVRRMCRAPADPHFEILSTAPARPFPGGVLAPLGVSAYAWTQQIAENTPLATAANYVRHRVFNL